MDLQSWILAGTGVVVGIPAVWMVRRSLKGPPRIRPNLVVELPTAEASTRYLVAAFTHPIDRDAPLTFVVVDGRAIAVAPGPAPKPTGQEPAVACVSIGKAGEHVGLVVQPGDYWVYAFAVDHWPHDELHTLDSMVTSARRGSAGVVPVGNGAMHVDDAAVAAPDGVRTTSVGLGDQVTVFLVRDRPA